MNRAEQALQIACVEWADRAAFPEFVWQSSRWLAPPVKIGEFLHHVPNGGARTPAEGGIFKAMGVRAGYPDLALDLAIVDGEMFWPGWRCEMKAPGEKMRPNQQLRAEQLMRAGYVFDTADTFEQFQAKLYEYLARGTPWYRGLRAG